MTQKDKPYRKLYRSRSDCQVDGVCGGLGEYLGIDPVIFRVIFVLTTFMGSAGFIVYIILCIAIPQEPKRPRHKGSKQSSDAENWDSF